MTGARRGLAALTLATLALTCFAAAAKADFNGSGSKDGLLSKIDIRRDAKHRGTLSISSKSFEYTSVIACADNAPGAVAEPSCNAAIAACIGNTPAQGLGPLIRVFRREVDSRGNGTGQWEQLGLTCDPSVVPGKPVLGLAQIISAFRRTPFAKPTVHIQPEGNTTLVTLPTYFQATWPEQGFQPGEVDTADPAQMLGHTVRIRPLATSYTYTFGDGTGLGPTSSPGGTYPDGDVTHTYDRSGTYPTRIAVTYGGEFSLDGGPWIRIPATATITGPTQPLQVRTAHNRLYNN